MSSAKKNILVTTSISPTNIQIQKMAIDTWLNLGLKVVSLNSKEEIEMIKPFFPEIMFYIVERTAKERFGKPYIYIYDFMKYLKNSDYTVCGIINSDIHFKGVGNDFIHQVYEEALDSLVYGHRVDVNHIKDTDGIVSNGVDYFFFNKNLIDIYDDDGLCMGQPAWDWWMVCVPASFKKSTKRVLSKIAFHQTHPQRWDQALNQHLIETIVFDKYLKNLYPNANQYELNSKMWDIVISKSGIEFDQSTNQVVHVQSQPDVDRTADRINAYDGRLSRLELTMTERLNMLEESLKRQGALTERLNTLEESLNHQNIVMEKLNTLEGSLNRQEATTERLNTLEESLNHQKAAMTDKLNTLEGSLNRQEATTERLNTLEESLNHQKAAMTDKLNTLEGSLNRQEAAVTDKLNTLEESLNHQKAAMTDKLNTLEESLNHQKAAMTDKLNTLEESLNRQEAAMTDKLNTLEESLNHQKVVMTDKLNTLERTLSCQEAIMTERFNMFEDFINRVNKSIWYRLIRK